MPRDAILAVDVHVDGYSALPHFWVYHPGTFIYSPISVSMGLALPSAIGAQIAYPDRKVVAIAGMGQAFCAGHDLKEIRSNNRREIFDGLLAQCSTLMTSIVRLPKPVIARVHGIATAAGCQLVASCDMAIASENATFATPGVNLGLFCSAPMVAVSRAVPRKHTMEMLLTGEEISANTAKDFGLVNKVVPAKELELVTSGLASKIASKSPLTLRVGKEAFYRQ